MCWNKSTSTSSHQRREAPKECHQKQKERKGQIEQKGWNERAKLKDEKKEQRDQEKNEAKLC